ncbi:hypothetical protein ACV566_09895 [Staphylococcus aureus]
MLIHSKKSTEFILNLVQQDLKNIDKEIAEIEQEINAYLKELGVEI